MLEDLNDDEEELSSSEEEVQMENAKSEVPAI